MSAPVALNSPLIDPLETCDTLHGGHHCTHWNDGVGMEECCRCGGLAETGAPTHPVVAYARRLEREVERLTSEGRHHAERHRRANELRVEAQQDAAKLRRAARNYLRARDSGHKGDEGATLASLVMAAEYHTISDEVADQFASDDV